MKAHRYSQATIASNSQLSLYWNLILYELVDEYIQYESQTDRVMMELIMFLMLETMRVMLHWSPAFW